jgi:hypothetical protein
LLVALWIASRSLSSGAHPRDPLARNDAGHRRTVIGGKMAKAALDKIKAGLNEAKAYLDGSEDKRSYGIHARARINVDDKKDPKK